MGLPIWGSASSVKRIDRARDRKIKFKKKETERKEEEKTSAESAWRSVSRLTSFHPLCSYNNNNNIHTKVDDQLTTTTT